MKKLHVLALALVAVFAFSAMAVATASAETTLLAEWLVDGAPIPVGTTFNTETTGEILLEDNKTFLGAVSMLCSGILDGTIGPNGEDLVTAVLDLAGKLISLGGTLLVCTNEHNCEGGTAAPEGLPWPTLLFLMENGEFLDLIEGSGYTSTCTVLGSKIEDTCTSTDTELPVVNDVGGFALTPENSEAVPRANCTQGGALAGVNVTEGDSTIKITPAGHTLQVSSE